MNKKLLLILLLAFSCITNSYSQDKHAAAKEMLDLLQTEKTVNALLDNMVSMSRTQAEKMFNTETDKDKFNNYMEFVFKEAQIMSYNLIDKEMANIYENNFSEQELKDMIAFYKTPTGKKLVEKTPEISQQISQIMMEKYLPEFQNKVQTKLQELQK